MHTYISLSLYIYIYIYTYVYMYYILAAWGAGAGAGEGAVAILVARASLGSSRMWCLRMWCLIIIVWSPCIVVNYMIVFGKTYHYQTPHPQTPHPWTPNSQRKCRWFGVGCDYLSTAESSKLRSFRLRSIGSSFLGSRLYLWGSHPLKERSRLSQDYNGMQALTAGYYYYYYYY